MVERHIKLVSDDLQEGGRHRSQVDLPCIDRHALLRGSTARKPSTSSGETVFVTPAAPAFAIPALRGPRPHGPTARGEGDDKAPRARTSRRLRPRAWMPRRRPSQAPLVARLTARTIRRCVPHRQRFSASASLISRRLGPGCGEQLRGLHDHPIDAVAALDGLFVDEGLLQGMRSLGRAETFERDDPVARRRAHRRHAGANGGAIQMDGACATLRQPATEARPVQSEVPAQCVQQGHRRVVDLHVGGPPVHIERDSLRHEPQIRSPSGSWIINQVCLTLRQECYLTIRSLLQMQ